MANLNKIVLVGRLTADPESRNVGPDSTMTKFTLAVSRPRRMDGTPGETDFLDIVSWGRQAENVAKYCAKGKTVLVEGRIQVRTYNDASGQKKWATEVMSNQVVFLSGPSAQESAEEKEAPELTGSEAQSAAPAAEAFSAEPVPAEEDIPF
jgi:single-strand DNA-binding protein